MSGDDGMVERESQERVAALVDRLQRRVGHDAQLAVRRANRLARLEQEMGELALLVRALYVYQRAQPGFDPARFAAIVAEIDRADGVADGQARMPAPAQPAAPAPPPRRRRI